jgi:ribosomal protein L11 methylase PrmA
VLRPGGTLVASGFNVGEVEAVKAALAGVREVRIKGEWALIMTAL